MSRLRSLRRKLNPKKVWVAKTLAKMQTVEPDPQKLKERFQELFEQVLNPRQTVIETFQGKDGQ